MSGIWGIQRGIKRDGSLRTPCNLGIPNIISEHPELGGLPKVWEFCSAIAFWYRFTKFLNIFDT